MPTPTSTRRRATRRDELIEAALRCFVARGVQATSVDDIVRDAGAAKGTFYLYFTTRDDIVTAVAERLMERIAVDMIRGLEDQALSPAARIRGIPAAMLQVTPASLEAALIAEIHRPENAPIHDRLASTIFERLLPGVTKAIAQGIGDGDFPAQDPGHAAAFVLATFSAVDQLVREPADLESVVHAVQAFVLRGLGYAEGRR